MPVVDARKKIIWVFCHTGASPTPLYPSPSFTLRAEVGCIRGVVDASLGGGGGGGGIS